MHSAALTSTFPSKAEGLRASTTLNNSVKMPWLGLGVYQVDGDAMTERVVRTAIEQGYRSVDTAALYGNERGVGNAVKNCGVSRAELFVTTKVWNDDVRADRVEAAFETSLRRLGLEYVDLILIHWPIAGKIVSAWKAAEKILRGGKARAIGVSNHMIPHLEELLAAADVTPAVNQIEFHPYLQSKPLHAFCRGKGIQLQAWSPLMQAGALLQDAKLRDIAKKHGKSVAQVILRWDVQSGVVTIPKSEKPQRIAENADVFNFVLSESEMATIAALDRNQRNGADPFHFNF